VNNTSKNNPSKTNPVTKSNLRSALRRLLLSSLLGQLASVLGAAAEPLALEVEDVRCDDKRDSSGGEDETRDGELPFGARSDVGVERRGVESGDAGEEVAAETVAAGGAGGVLAVGGDLEGVLVLDSWVLGEGRRGNVPCSHRLLGRWRGWRYQSLRRR
jgi:hypothetical protein